MWKKFVSLVIVPLIDKLSQHETLSTKIKIMAQNIADEELYIQIYPRLKFYYFCGVLDWDKCS